MDFLDLTRPAKVRDNIRRAAVDLACLTLLVEALALELDSLPPARPDGVPDLDGTTVGFLGHSPGGTEDRDGSRAGWNNPPAGPFPCTTFSGGTRWSKTSAS